MTDKNRLKIEGDAENEVHKAGFFNDLGFNIVSPIATFDEATALGVVSVLSRIVTSGHDQPINHQRDANGVIRAQVFEEGAVLMTGAPFEGFSADRYLMDFYDVKERGICSRMHFHTGMRFVRMMTGPRTEIRVSALSPIRLAANAPSLGIELRIFEDKLASDEPAEAELTRYNLIVPPCAWVDMQIPRGTSHQFNAVGPHAVIDSVHPEESIEIFREQVSRANMMAQTIFLQAENPPAASCVISDSDARSFGS